MTSASPTRAAGASWSTASPCWKRTTYRPSCRSTSRARAPGWWALCSSPPATCRSARMSRTRRGASPGSTRWRSGRSRWSTCRSARRPMSPTSSSTSWRAGWCSPATHSSGPSGLGPHGRIVRGWIPQRSVLAHPAVGGFLSHCGWNSVMESLAAGKPVLAWPQMAEQHLNAHHVTHIIGAGVRITAAGGAGAVVGRAEVEHKIRRLMDAGDSDGQKMRAKAAWAQKAAKSAVSDGGTSRVALLKLVEELLGSYCDIIAANDNQINRPRRDDTDAHDL
ncbi:hypothetical protein VPH35_103967 [Triticum aestivum]